MTGQRLPRMDGETDFELNALISAGLGADVYSGPHISTHGIGIYAVWSESACGIVIREDGNEILLSYEQACGLANALKHVIPSLADLMRSVGDL